LGRGGLIQPIADGLKLLLKEIIVPSSASKGIFIIAPMLAIAPALAAWAVVPFTDTLVLANIDASLLYIMAITSIGVYGVILIRLGVKLEIRFHRCNAISGPDGLL
jgi:NADH-quinone oxidoreductase subunit H